MNIIKTGTWKIQNYIRLLCVLFIFQTLQIKGQIILINEMPRPIYYDRTMRIKKFKDMKSFRDVFHSDNLLLGRSIFSGSISQTMGRILINDNATSYHYEFRNSTGVFLSTQIINGLTLNTTFYKNFNKEAIQPWTSDFTYSLGWYNWRPGTFSFGYENYENNKYDDKLTYLGEKFLRGSFFISYQFVHHPLRIFFHKKIQPKMTFFNKLKIDSTSRLGFSYFVRYAPTYRDINQLVKGGIFSGKPTVGLSSRYTIARGIYIEGALNFYMNQKQKQPWDPDFTYGLGYFDWRPFRASFTYGSYVINRFPWNKTEYQHFGFLDGNFKFVFNYSW